MKKKRAVGRIYAKRVFKRVRNETSLFASKFLWNEDVQVYDMIIIRRKRFE